MAECKHAGELTTVAENLNTDQTQFTCSICMGHYRNPRYLPTCGHTFCEHCLLKYTRNIQQEGQGSKFACPVCRKPNKLPEHDEVTLQWVQTFPLNTVIVKMMEALPPSSEGMKEERRMCDPCKEEGETTAGLKFCIDCKEVLCKTCTKYHKNFKLSKNHKLIDVGDITAEKSHVDFFADVGKCVEHPERDVEIYCKTHDAVMCLLCSSFQHNTCEISEIAGNEIDITKLQNDSKLLISQMKSTIEHINNLQKLRTEIKTNLKQKLKEIRENIEHVRDQVVELMDSIVGHVSDVTKQIEIEREDGLDSDMSRVAKTKEQMEEKIALLDTIEQHGSDKHKFVSTHLGKKTLEETCKQISDEDKHMKQFDAKLVIADNLKKLIASTNVKKLVQIKVTESESSHTPLASVPTLQRDTAESESSHTPFASVPTLQRDTAESESSHTPLASVLTQPIDTGVVANVLRDSKLVMVEEHSVRPGAAYDPCYTGIAIHRDGRVILTGAEYMFGYGCYGCVCLYNTSQRTKLQLRLTGRQAFSTVQIDDTHLAVSNPDNKTITIVSVGNELRAEKTLKTQYKPRSIVALNNGGQLAVTWDEPPAFGVISISGTEVVQKSYLDKDTSGRNFKSFEYLAVDERRQHVIQPCTTDKAVFCFDYTGKPVFKYTHPRLTYPRGVALDKCGNIYVCEWNIDSIHKLSPTGDPISVITEGVPLYPLAICSDVTGTGFWVTRYSEPYDKVAYFRLQ